MLQESPGNKPYFSTILCKGKCHIIIQPKKEIEISDKILCKGGHKMKMSKCSQTQGQFLWKLPEPWKRHLPI